MSVVEEIREQQKKALSTMSFQQKMAYFWEYYKIHALVVIAVSIAVISFIVQYVNNKDYAFYAALINTVSPSFENEITTKWAEEFQEYAQIDPDEYQVYIDTSVALAEATDPQYRMSNEQKMFAMIQAGTVSALAADTETFEYYAQFEYFYRPEDIMTPEEIERYRPYFYYTDAATFDHGDDTDTDPQSEQNALEEAAALNIDHRDPSTMEQPMAVGIILTEDNLLAESGLYDYLKERSYTYQGHPSDVVIGIPVTNQDPKIVIRFLEYLQLGEG